nr:sulfurtransferase [Tissierella sp.]
MKNFKDSKWLLENIKAKDLIVLDARAALMDPLEGKRQYDLSHIRGARYVDLEEILTGEIETHGGRHPLPELDEFIENMEYMGVGDSSKVLIYDDGSLAMAGRLWYLFKLIGKEDVYILEGGIEAFLENGGELTEEVPVLEERGNLSLNLKDDILVDMDYVKEKIDDETTAIVDVRAYERYIGEVEPLDKIAGHIKSAVNYPWMELVQKGERIDLKKLEMEFKNLKDYKEIIVHCGSGITGTVAMMLLDEIGKESKLYSGGYSDWVSYKDNRVVKGRE